jgi:hypothetical protein
MDQRIIDYIKNAQSAGTQMWQIKQNLITAGWREKDVDEAIKSIEAVESIKKPIRTEIFPSEPEEKKPSKISTTMILAGIVVLIVVIFLAWWLITRPVCGNGKLEKGETPDTCCKDAGCLGQQTCKENICVEPTCGECQYLESHTCKNYKCCKDSQCADTENCQDHNCIVLNCTSCQYLLNHSCMNYGCCSDLDCNDSNSSTIDVCNSPRTLSASCSHLVNACNNNSNCNDNLNSTRDICSGTPKICSHVNITECLSNDSYCPVNCTYINDTDCPRIITFTSCGTNLDCFIDAGNRFAMANVTNTTTMNNSGMNITAKTTYYEIKGNESANIIVYFRYDNSTIAYTDVFIKALNDSGKSLPEITVMENDAKANASLIIGHNGTCYLNTTLFNKWFFDWNSSGSCSCAGTCTFTGDWLQGNCTGDYFCS